MVVNDNLRYLWHGTKMNVLEPILRNVGIAFEMREECIFTYRDYKMVVNEVLVVVFTLPMW